MNVFIPTSIDYIISILIFIFSLSLPILIAKKIGLKYLESGLLTAATLVFVYFRYLIIASGPWSDSHYYYLTSFNNNLDIGFGSKAIFILTSMFSSIGIGFMPTMFLFSILTVLTIQFLFAAYRLANNDRRNPALTLFFLISIVPSVSFWGGAIGKDALALLGVSMFCWALVSRNLKIGVLIIGAILVMIVRPHIGILMFAATAFASTAAKDIVSKYRILLLSASAATIFVILPSIILYVGIDSANLSAEVLDTVEASGDRFKDSGSFISLSDMPIPLRMLSYLFRPLPFEASTITQFFAALQNTIILGCVLYLSIKISYRGNWTRALGGVAMLLYALAALTLLANVTSNLGIAVRQKQMLIPPLLLALIYFDALPILRTSKKAMRLPRTSVAMRKI